MQAGARFVGRHHAQLTIDELLLIHPFGESPRIVDLQLVAVCRKDHHFVAAARSVAGDIDGNRFSGFHRSFDLWQRSLPRRTVREHFDHARSLSVPVVPIDGNDGVGRKIAESGLEGFWMHASVSRLKLVMPPSPLPTVAPPPWADIERAIATRLPRDYRDFIDLYGNGRINDELSVQYPAVRRTDSRVILTALPDFTLPDVGSVGTLADDHHGDVELCSFPEPGGLLQWGSTHGADMFFWVTEGDDPDKWPVMAFHRYDCTFHRYDGGMVDFLVDVVTGGYEHWRAFIGERPGGARWTMYSDWGIRYGQPPHASFDLSGDGVRCVSGSVIPLCPSSNTGGGDQDVYGCTGAVVPLISLDEDCATVRLDGGGLAPGIAYHVFAWLMPNRDTESLRLELLCDGTPLAAESAVADTPPARQIEAQILVPANAPTVRVQLRFHGERPDSVVPAQGFYMWIKGTLGD
jgi:hypothetical protein